MPFRRSAALALVAGLAAVAPAQVVLNEVLENPPGAAAQSDAFAEYIELYGFPGMSLDGYAIACIKGGTDPDGDGIVNVPPEIDEAFRLDGFSIGANGFFVLYNGTAATSFIPPFLPPDANSGSFFTAHIPTSDTNGNLANDGSSTYVLVRARPLGAQFTFGSTLRKDINPDVDFDSRLDLGVEPGSLQIEPLQIIDDVAWSNEGGKEYTRSSEQEISDTPGFNPDGLNRVAYYGSNPGLGFRINSTGDTVPTRMADEEFIYGETNVGANFIEFDAVRYGAPTDPAGDGFADINAAGFEFTPGSFNDSASLNITQFRFVAGDTDFDGDADCDDLALATTFLGRSFSETADYLDPDTGLPVADPNGPGNIQAYAFQGRLANAFLAATNLVLTDGTAGANSPTVTQADLDALAALAGNCQPACLADLNGDGLADFGDVGLFVGAFASQDLLADLNGDGLLDFGDVGLFVAAFAQGC
jgi:hypothetical protein